jgi:hypothetical protein
MTTKSPRHHFKYQKYDIASHERTTAQLKPIKPPRRRLKFHAPMNDATFRQPPLHNLEQFTRMLQPEYFSVEMIIYNMLVQDDLSKQLEKKWSYLRDRCKDEATLIEDAEDPAELMHILEAGFDNVNERAFRDKALNWSGEVTRLILDRLKDNQDEHFLEVAIHVLYDAAVLKNVELEKNVISMMDQTCSPYTLSLLAVLLGLVGSEYVVPQIWRAFWFLRAIKSKYYNGPLLALGELVDRAERGEIGQNFLRS